VEVRRPPPRLLGKETRRKADALKGSSQRPQARSGRADGRAPPQDALRNRRRRMRRLSQRVPPPPRSLDRSKKCYLFVSKLLRIENEMIFGRSGEREEKCMT